MLHMLEALRRRTVDQDGQTMAEYGVVLSVVTIAALGALVLLGANIVNAITRVTGIVGG
jgi:Flp pilus assembly pilin Flp